MNLIFPVHDFSYYLKRQKYVFISSVVIISFKSEELTKVYRSDIPGCGNHFSTDMRIIVLKTKSFLYIISLILEGYKNCDLHCLQQPIMTV